MSSVIGPTESRAGKRDKASLAKVEVMIKSGNNEMGDVHSMEATVLEYVLSQVQADQFPRCLIQVVLHVLTLDGSLLSALCNSAAVALQRSGIPMKRSGTLSAGARCSLEHVRGLLWRRDRTH